MWQCTNEPCLGTCAAYGDGHYITFDGQRYSFSGACEYTLAQVRGQASLTMSFSLPAFLQPSLRKFMDLLLLEVPSNVSLPVQLIPRAEWKGDSGYSY